MKNIARVLSMLVVVPIWYYLIYQILQRVAASELMWFLFWIYVPVHVLAQLLVSMSKEDSE